MAACYAVLRQRNQNIRRNRIFRDRNNPLDYLDDREIIRKYRISRPMILDLCRRFENELKRPTNRSNAFSVSLQIRFFVTGSFQLLNADVHRISRSSVSHIIRDVTACLKNICQQHIRMPTDQELLTRMRQGFNRTAKFPNVIGAVDGTHIRIKAPSVDEQFYINGKNYHSVNVMGVCDYNLKFLNVVARWPGSTHDSFVLTNSRLCEMFDTGEIGEGWLLGDSGYPLRPWLLTPVLNPTSREEQRYNSSHMRTRCVVGRAFGVLKSRFRCIDTSAGTLLYKQGKCCDIVIVVVVLHNFCIDNRIPLPLGNDQVDNGNIGGNQYVGNQNDGASVRRRLINNRSNV